MKALILFATAVVAGATGFGTTLENKSLRVGTAADPNAFSGCVAREAMTQILADASFHNLLHSAPVGTGKPAINAQLTFLGDVLGKNVIYRIVLESLDTVNGWQLVQHASGEVAPFTTSLSDRAFVFQADGEEVGDFDLSPCANE